MARADGGGAESHVLLRPTAGRRARPIGKRSLRLAGFGIRAAAWIVDVVAAVVVLWLLTFGSEVVTRSPAIGLVVAILFVLWYHVYLIGQSGQTWGMRWLGVRVVNEGAGTYPIGLGKAFVRALIAFLMGITFVAGIIDLLWAIWDPYHQTLHDKVAQTVVVSATSL